MTATTHREPTIASRRLNLEKLSLVNGQHVVTHVRRGTWRELRLWCQSQGFSWVSKPNQLYKGYWNDDAADEVYAVDASHLFRIPVTK